MFHWTVKYLGERSGFKIVEGLESFVLHVLCRVSICVL